MPTYKVLSPIKVGGKIRATGSTVEIDEATAAPLLGTELERLAKAEAAKPNAKDDGKKDDGKK